MANIAKTFLKMQHLLMQCYFGKFTALLHLGKDTARIKNALLNSFLSYSFVLLIKCCIFLHLLCIYSFLIVLLSSFWTLFQRWFT